MRQKLASEAVLVQQTEDVAEVVDVEQFAKSGRTPPPGKKYRIRIDKKTYDIAKEAMTGRQLLKLAGKAPEERFMISQKFASGQVRKIDLDEKVEIIAPGTERFMTLAKDQTEG
jgi:hypothetical protein